MISDKFIWLRHQLNNHFVGKLFPVSWFGPKAPAKDELSIPTGKIKLEIVSHCWQYSHMLNFQLSSLVNYTPHDIDVRYTLFHSTEDQKLLELIGRFDAMAIDNISWNWQAIPKTHLFRRAIGRNSAALSSNADWLWFSDCDLIFHKDCLDSLAQALRGKQERLVFPQQEFITDLLPAEHAMLNQNPMQNVDIDVSLFTPNAITKAKGAFQIVHGDVARQCGYCKEMSLYQQPSTVWRKTFEDSMFRRLIESEGVPIQVNGLHRIRHQEKGRYASGSKLSRLRKNIRVATDDQG